MKTTYPHRVMDEIMNKDEQRTTKGVPSIAYYNSISKGMMWLIILAVINLVGLLIHGYLHPW